MVPPDDLSTLDFLRALATIDVVGCHLLAEFGHGTPSVANVGRLAILIFFVHTCYVLMLSLERLQQRAPERLWRRFMVRRCLRIYPLPVAVLALIVLFRVPSRMLADGSFEFMALGKIELFSNFALAMNLTNARSLLSPLWSLPYEMQMYLFLPAIFLLARRRGVRTLMGIWCIAVVAGVLLPLIPHSGRFGLIQFIPCFLPGVIAYKLAQTATRRIPFAGWVLVCTAIFLASGLLPTATQWMVAWLACLAIGVAVPFMAETKSRAVRSASHWIAEHSYGVYLVHYFCIWVAFRANALPRLWQTVLFAIALVALASAAYRWVERPLNELGRKLSGQTAPAAKLALAAESARS